MFDINLINSPGFQSSKTSERNVVSNEVEMGTQSGNVSTRKQEDSQVEKHSDKTIWNRVIWFLGIIAILCGGFYGYYEYNSSKNPVNNNKVIMSDIVGLLLSESTFIHSIEFYKNEVFIVMNKLDNQDIFRIKNSIDNKSSQIKLINNDTENKVEIFFPWVSHFNQDWVNKIHPLTSKMDRKNSMLTVSGNNTEIVSVLLQLLENNIIESCKIVINNISELQFKMEISSI